ncbi:hypothetical protein OKW21_005440 [Catalinimonas alkaloidigena]|uniref:hypothetical protein n=1 Tax=Catalinimonas alkaloidigena TaxID=1075417 RepID=UPI002406C8D5|nr:hypothetical protein [Catalinimonas alkaloidigena]MDF9800177.1 hypothetical protein [Catalinimonas alkaloidigena]
MIKHKKGKNPKSTEDTIRVLIDEINEVGITLSEKNAVCLYELQCSFENKIRPGFIVSILQEMKRSNESNIQAFVEQHDMKEKEYKKLKASLTQKWEIFIPINIKPRKKKILFEDVEILFYAKSTIKKNISGRDFLNVRSDFGEERIKKLTSSHVLDSLSKYCLSIKCSGSDIYEAWKAAEPYYDLIRGIFEFVVSPTYQLIPPFKKRAKIGDPEIIIGSNSNNEWHYFEPISDTHHQCFNIKFGEEQNRVLFNIINIFSKKGLKPKSFTSLLADAFRLYSQAMDSIYSYDCLINLWQMCERMTCAGNMNGSTKDVVKRLGWHSERLSLSGSGWNEALIAISKKRNEIVHRGFTKVEDEEINILLIVAKCTLRWLLSMNKELNTERQLEEYYQMRTLSPSELASKKSVISLIEKERKNSL